MLHVRAEQDLPCAPTSPPFPPETPENLSHAGNRWESRDWTSAEPRLLPSLTLHPVPERDLGRALGSNPKSPGHPWSTSSSSHPHPTCSLGVWPSLGQHSTEPLQTSAGTLCLLVTLSTAFRSREQVAQKECVALETHDGSSRDDVLGALGGLPKAQFPPEEAVSYPGHRETGHSEEGPQPRPSAKALQVTWLHLLIPE